MKYLFLGLLLLTGCFQEVKENSKIEIDASLNISKTENGFDIYSNKGILILEYTNQNCDSTELKLLDEICSTAKEFNNVIEVEEIREGSKSI